MPEEFPESQPIFVGAERLGRLVGRSGRWVREREVEGVIERELGNGGGAKARPLYDADETLPKLVAYLAARKGPSPETQELARQRVEAGRLKLEQARIEFALLQGSVCYTAQAIAVFTDLIVECRQSLMQTPGRVKTTLGFTVVQVLGLQKEIGSVLTAIRDKGKKALARRAGRKPKEAAAV